MVPLARKLERSFAVYALDLPGFGVSEKPRQALSISELAERLRLWLGAVGLGRVCLLGHSLGSEVVVDLAARHPELAEKVIIVGPTVDPALRSYRRQIPRWPIALAREPLGLLPILMGDYLAAGPKRVFGTLSTMFHDRVELKLPDVTAPTLVVRGSGDVLVPQSWVERMTALLPNGRLVVVDGAAHALNYGAPDVLANVVQPFLS